MGSIYKNKQIVARLLDKDGFTITESPEDTKKEAIDRAKYYLSDVYAKQAETTHSALGTAKAEVLIDGECHWDQFREVEEEKEDQFVTFFLDRQPTEGELWEIEMALNARAPEWGEYELAAVSGDTPAINMHSVVCPTDDVPQGAPEKEAVEGLKFLLEGMGVKVVEIAGIEEDES